jgi:copper homeostasis protein
VELCAGLVEGGTTPSAGTIALVRERVSLPVVVLVRPRAGDFLYEADELEIMRRDIVAARSLGAAAVAIGVLTPDGRVDAHAMRALVDAARPMPVTMHRAFDLTRHLHESLDVLLALGVDRVLTSGGAPTALAGRETLRALVARAGDALAILAGGRVDASSAQALVRDAGVRELHVRAAATMESAMRFRRDGITFGTPYAPDEYRWREVSEPLVRELVASLAGIIP